MKACNGEPSVTDCDDNSHKSVSRGVESVGSDRYREPAPWKQEIDKHLAFNAQSTAKVNSRWLKAEGEREKFEVNPNFDRQQVKVLDWAGCRVHILLLNSFVSKVYCLFVYVLLSSRNEDRKTWIMDRHRETALHCSMHIKDEDSDRRVAYYSLCFLIPTTRNTCIHICILGLPPRQKTHTKNTTNSDTAFWKHIKQIISWTNGDRKQQNSVCNFHISFQYFLTEPTANFTQRPRRTTLSHSYASLHGSPVGITINNWSRYFYTAR